jgi:putative hemolysin
MSPVALVEPEPLARPEDPAELAAEVAALPPGSVVVAERGFRVLLIAAQDAPAILREIGLQRERTFRAAHEGSGRARDLDRFDDTYLQLVLWDEVKGGVAGGYRLGLVDRLLRSDGANALYTHGAFEYHPQMVRHLDRAVELGRSFVTSEYQRGFAPLLLLWRGIGAVLDRLPRYRLLVGSVSVSAAYSDASRQAIASYLLAGPRRSAWAPLVRPRRPFRSAALCAPDLRALDDAIVAQDRKKPPVLVKHYLQLGMRGLACGIDPDFGGCLDVLCVADLRDAPLATLQRFMGEAPARAFLDRHGARSVRVAA